MKSFLIVGLGSFGHHLCRALAEQKCEVMVADQVSETLEDLLPLVVSAKVGDCTNEEVLRSFDIPSFDACFVCLGDSNILGSLQITSLLKELGAKKVFSKADDDVQAKFLLRNGADEVIYPELEVAVSLAVSESSDSIFDCIRLTADYSIYELQPLPRWVGKSLKELNFRVKCNLTVIAAIRDGVIRPNLSPDYTFREDEHLLVLGRIEDIHRVIR
ncbi:MAG: TrkA family potassium uptake protein [Oscillospiraceae bacterium]|jgi:trk system potassium uptake protein TrkA|nr:TrkA family potassium uptake protein [Oscillospiraceae bacterium]